MIRVYKEATAPSSLSTTTRYDGEDVKRQLLSDQHEKCYICERQRTTDFEIEHHKSVTHYPALRLEWSNLFLACRYCNGKKSDNFDNTLNPKDWNIEDEIRHDLDFSNKKALFSLMKTTPQHKETIEMLNKMFNGTGAVRKIKEERFFEYVISVMNRFQALVNAFLANQSPETEKAVRDELSIDKEFLGFKYWIVKGNETLNHVFTRDLAWNKRM